MQNFMKYVNPTMVVSVAVGMAAFGAVTYVAVKSGIKPLKQAAKVVK